MADPVSKAAFEEVVQAISDEELISFTQEFIQIESVNGNEAPAADFVVNACKEAGLKITVEEVQPGRPNVLAVLPGESEDIAILFHGHTDTVPFFEMKDPVSGEISDGYIWGRGSVDQKGGLAAAIVAVLSLARAGYKPKKSLAIAAVIDEESEHRGSWTLAQRGIKADFAITTEPSDLHLEVAHKGTAPMRVDFQGVLAHGSNPWVGVNAIELAAKFVLALKDVEMKQVDIPGVGSMQASYNVGLIEGGTQYNNVADQCSIFLDRRMVPGENQTQILAEVQLVIDKLAAEDPKFKASVSVARPDWKWEVIRERGLNPSMSSPGSEIAKAISEAYRQETGEEVKITFTNGYNDGDFLNNDLKITTVNYGPGESNRSHTVEEKLLIDHLVTARRVLVRTILAIAG